MRETGFIRFLRYFFAKFPFLRFALGFFEPINKITDRRADNDDVADNAERLGNLIQEQEPEERRKEHLRVIEHGDFLGGRLFIGGGDKELPARGGEPRKHQIQPLHTRHGFVVDNHKGEGYERGEGGEKEDDDIVPFSLFTEHAHAV